MRYRNRRMPVDRANPDKIELIKSSSKRLVFKITGFPAGITVVSARWMFKASQTAADEAALISKQVNLSPGPDGHVEDAGISGTAAVAIQIDPDDLVSVSQKSGISSLKVTLSDGQSSEVPGLRLPVSVVGAVIVAA